MVETRNNQTERNTEFGIESNVEINEENIFIEIKPIKKTAYRRIVNSQYVVQIENINLTNDDAISTKGLTQVSTGAGIDINGDIAIDIESPFGNLVPKQGAIFFFGGSLYFGNGKGFTRIANDALADISK